MQQGARIWSGLALAALVASLTFATTALADLHAEFTWSPQQVEPGQTVTFTSTSTEATTYAWDLDNDGQFDDGTDPTASRSWDSAGSYHVKLEVTNASGQTDTADHSIKVTTGLASSFTWSPQSPATGEQITLTSTSTIKSGSIRTYSWDLNGDRRFDDVKGASATYSFADAGDHQVGLRVTDNTGARSTAFNTITVVTPPPPPAEDPPAPPPAPPAEPTPEPAPATPASPAGPLWLNPFPSVRVRGRATYGGVHLSLLATRAPIGSTLKVRCEGKRCPRKAVRTYTFESERLRLKGHERFYTAGTKLEIFIWQKGLVG
ncbi:MAG: hypothetical protein QOJ29_33, partial [Thermoleophilaceae bacterium]|nr:hypothetical protein [Thermoleophilaceae bacterium]